MTDKEKADLQKMTKEELIDTICRADKKYSYKDIGRCILNAAMDNKVETAQNNARNAEGKEIHALFAYSNWRKKVEQDYGVPVCWDNVPDAVRKQGITLRLALATATEERETATKAEESLYENI